VPYRVIEGSTCVFDRPDRREGGGDAWWIELADGRVIIFAQSRSAE
jgi:hypothetical protein